MSGYEKYWLARPPENMRELVEEVIRQWRRLSELEEFAKARHGFGNSDVGHGVTYPEDLEPHDIPMPHGNIMVYGGFGKYFRFWMPETTYLDILAEVFRRNGLGSAAKAMADLSQRLASGPNEAPA